MRQASGNRFNISGYDASGFKDDAVRGKKCQAPAAPTVTLYKTKIHVTAQHLASMPEIPVVTMERCNFQSKTWLELCMIPIYAYYQSNN
jgi:hypothetical protein